MNGYVYECEYHMWLCVYVCDFSVVMCMSVCIIYVCMCEYEHLACRLRMDL